MYTQMYKRYTRMVIYGCLILLLTSQCNAGPEEWGRPNSLFSGIWPSWEHPREKKKHAEQTYNGTLERTQLLYPDHDMADPDAPKESRFNRSNLIEIKNHVFPIIGHWLNSFIFDDTYLAVNWLDKNLQHESTLLRWDVGSLTASNCCPSNYFAYTPYRSLHGLGGFTSAIFQVGHPHGHTILDSNPHIESRTNWYTTDYGWQGLRDMIPDLYIRQGDGRWVPPDDENCSGSWTSGDCYRQSPDIYAVISQPMGTEWRCPEYWSSHYGHVIEDNGLEYARDHADGNVVGDGGTDVPTESYTYRYKRAQGGSVSARRIFSNGYIALAGFGDLACKDVFPISVNITVEIVESQSGEETTTSYETHHVMLHENFQDPYVTEHRMGPLFQSSDWPNLPPDWSIPNDIHNMGYHKTWHIYDVGWTLNPESTDNNGMPPCHNHRHYSAKDYTREGAIAKVPSSPKWSRYSPYERPYMYTKLIKSGGHAGTYEYTASATLNVMRYKVENMPDNIFKTVRLYLLGDKYNRYGEFNSQNEHIAETNWVLHGTVVTNGTEALFEEMGNYNVYGMQYTEEESYPDSYPEYGWRIINELVTISYHFDYY